MAYEASNPIQRLGPQGASNAVWLYVDGDALATIDGAGYFNLESDRLKVNDVIIAVGNSVVGIASVNANSGGTVDTTNFAGQATIDSD